MLHDWKGGTTCQSEAPSGHTWLMHSHQEQEACRPGCTHPSPWKSPVEVHPSQVMLGVRIALTSWITGLGLEVGQ